MRFRNVLYTRITLCNLLYVIPVQSLCLQKHSNSYFPAAYMQDTLIFRSFHVGFDVESWSYNVDAFHSIIQQSKTITLSTNKLALVEYTRIPFPDQRYSMMGNRTLKNKCDWRLHLGNSSNFKSVWFTQSDWILNHCFSDSTFVFGEVLHTVLRCESSWNAAFVSLYEYMYVRSKRSFSWLVLCECLLQLRGECSPLFERSFLMCCEIFDLD